MFDVDKYENQSLLDSELSFEFRLAKKTGNFGCNLVNKV